MSYLFTEKIWRHKSIQNMNNDQLLAYNLAKATCKKIEKNGIEVVYIISVYLPLINYFARDKSIPN